MFDSVLNMILVSGLEERTKIPQEGEIKKKQLTSYYRRSPFQANDVDNLITIHVMSHTVLTNNKKFL